MSWSQSRLPGLVALLLVTSAALFAVGTAIEHSQRAGHHAEHPAAVSAATKSGETSTEKKAKGESSDVSSGEKKPAKAVAPNAGNAETGGETHSEKIARIDPESWPLVAVAIAVTLLMAAGVYRRRGRWLAAAAGFGIVFAAADVRELVHQINESRRIVATIAGILIGLHLLAALAAGAAFRRRAREPGQPASVT